MDTQVPGIAVTDLSRLLDDGGSADGVVLIDVREESEYVSGHAPSARLVPLQTVPEAVGTLPTDAPVYVICHSGGRSHRAAEFLRAQGVDAVNVLGGTSAWIEAGLPVATGLSGDER